MIVYGTNSFKIKSFTPRELGLTAEEGLKNIDIQVRQAYGHLYWIPFFPTKKIYGFKRPGDSNLYELPAEIKQVLEYKYSQDIKTPWYSYSLPLLGLLVGLWFFGQSKMGDIRYEDRFYLQQAKNKMMVKYPTTGDYYSFKAYYAEKTNDGASIILKVNSYDENSIEFTEGYEDIYSRDVYSISGEFKREGHYTYHPTRIDKDLLLKMMTVENRGDDAERFKMEAYDDSYFQFRKLERKELEVQ